MIESTAEVRSENMLRACTLRDRDSDSFGALVRNLPGIDPSDVVTTVNGLADDGVLTR